MWEGFALLPQGFSGISEKYSGAFFRDKMAAK
jgi:hypothetical protein